MHLTPAEYVIKVFGGVSKTAKSLDRSEQSVFKWNQSRKKGGYGGRIPGTLHKSILNRAEAHSLNITHRDLFEGRQVSESELALLDVQSNKTNQTAKENAAIAQFPPKKPIDTEWFHKKIKFKHSSLRRFAKMMQGRHGKKFDVAALSLMLRGKREMLIGEACQISRLLNEPFMSILQHAGEDVPE